MNAENENRLSINCRSLYGMNNEMKEVNKNQEATTFIEENHAKLVTFARIFGASEGYAEDAVHDVYMRYKTQENNGCGYDISKGNHGSVITIEEAVYGRLKRYCKNSKYRVGNSVHTTARKEIASSSSTEDLESMNVYQMIYNSAESYDDIELIDQEMSVAEELTYILCCEKNLSVPALGVLKNLDTLIESVGSIDSSLFSDFRCAGKEFIEAFKGVLGFAIKNPDRYNQVLDMVTSELV